MNAILAIVILLASGGVMLTLLRVVKNFGAYTESQRRLNESNLIVHQANLRMLEQLRKLDPVKEGKVA